MGIEEFDTAFDVLYNNISSDRAPSLNRYEKSVFLTKAQDEIVKNYFFSSGESLNGFDDNPKRQIDFSLLITNGTGTYVASQGLYDPRALVYTLPTKILFIINESVHFLDTTNNKVIGIRQVMPIAYDEYTRLMNKPYKEPLKNQAWRLFVQAGDNATSQKADLLIRSNDVDDYLEGDKANAQTKMSYNVRFVRNPQPIILEELQHYSNDLYIHDEHEPMGCELDPAIHEEILQRAVELAKAAWAG